jgi:hypothetical protein
MITCKPICGRFYGYNYALVVITYVLYLKGHISSERCEESF